MAGQRRGKKSGRDRRWGIASTVEADADLNRLKRRNKSAWQEVQKFIEDVLAVHPWPPQADELREPYDGCFGVHIGRDKYRIIWEVDSEIHVAVILRVGPKKKPGGGTIYDDPRPSLS